MKVLPLWPLVVLLVACSAAPAARATSPMVLTAPTAPAAARTARPGSAIPRGTEPLPRAAATPAARSATRSSASSVAPPSQAPASTGTPTIMPQDSATAEREHVLAAQSVAYSYPIGIPGRPLGDGCFIRDAYAAENTWFSPGWWHTAEDWYAVQGTTAGASVYAVADGMVVYAGANYPGRVVIVRHTDGLFSLYGHLAPALSVRVGERVSRGQLIGTVRRGGDPVPGHLHFEIRTFLTRRDVNGAAPRYRYKCGVNCLPGPGYWPIKAPDHPSSLGWRNPSHVIALRAFTSAVDGTLGTVVVAAPPAGSRTTLWSAASGDGTARQVLGELSLQPGTRFPLLAIRAGAEDSPSTSALSYQIWYRIRLEDGRTGWVQAAVPAGYDKGSDGRPSSVRFNFLPTTPAAP